MSKRGTRPSPRKRGKTQEPLKEKTVPPQRLHNKILELFVSVKKFLKHVPLALTMGIFSGSFYFVLMLHQLHYLALFSVILFFLILLVFLSKYDFNEYRWTRTHIKAFNFLLIALVILLAVAEVALADKAVREWNILLQRTTSPIELSCQTCRSDELVSHPSESNASRQTEKQDFLISETSTNTQTAWHTQTVTFTSTLINTSTYTPSATISPESSYIVTYAPIPAISPTQTPRRREATNTPVPTAKSTQIPSDTPSPPHSTSTIIATFTPTATITPSETETPTSSPESTHTYIPSPSLTPSLPPGTVAITPDLTPTPVMTLTYTPSSINHEIFVTKKERCKRWEVHVKVAPDDAKITFSPAQAGDWREGKSIAITITVQWSDGFEKIEVVTLHKPDKDDCDDD